MLLSKGVVVAVCDDGASETSWALGGWSNEHVAAAAAKVHSWACGIHWFISFYFL